MMKTKSYKVSVVSIPDGESTQYFILAGSKSSKGYDTLRGAKVALKHFLKTGHLQIA